MNPDKRPSSTRPLGDFVGGRDNNFNLIRFLAASAVLYRHSYALSADTSMAEPLRPWLGITSGHFALDTFFFARDQRPLGYHPWAPGVRNVAYVIRHDSGAGGAFNGH